MKQLLLFFSLFIVVATQAQSQTPKTIKAAWEIQQADSKKTNERIDSIVRAITSIGTKPPIIEPKPSEPTGPVDPVAGDIEKYVSAFYSSSNVEVDANNTVTKIKGIKGPDLPYNGIANPTIIKPYLLNGEVVFTNQPNALYSVQSRANGSFFPVPEEFTLVFRKMPGTDWETLWNGWGDYYLGFGGGKIRVLNNSTYSNAEQPDYFSLTMLHVLVELNKATIWIDGVKAGEATSSDMYRRLAYTVGSPTNSVDYNWLATMFIERKMTDTERAEYFKAVKGKYAIGSLPAQPYAEEVWMTNANGRLTAGYVYKGANPEDKSKVQYKWWKLSPDLSKQVVIGTSASIPYQTGVKVTVKVTDNKGNSWMPISGTYN